MNVLHFGRQWTRFSRLVGGGFLTAEFVSTFLSKPIRTTLIDNGLPRWGRGIVELKSFFPVSTRQVCTRFGITEIFNSSYRSRTCNVHFIRVSCLGLLLRTAFDDLRRECTGRVAVMRYATGGVTYYAEHVSFFNIARLRNRRSQSLWVRNAVFDGNMKIIEIVPVPSIFYGKPRDIFDVVYCAPITKYRSSMIFFGRRSLILIAR